MYESGPIKVLLVEDHKLTRESLAFGLNKVPAIQVVGEAGNGQEALLLVEREQPDIVLMDIGLPVLNGIKATQSIKEHYPKIKVVMLTTYEEEEKVFHAFAAGADGYCLKEIKIERLVQAVEIVMEGGLLLDPGIAKFILKVMPLVSETFLKAQAQANEPKVKLSVREKEILMLVADGLNNKDIADRLSISLYTVKNHVSSIIQKLAVEDRTQAAIFALKKDLI